MISICLAYLIFTFREFKSIHKGKTAILHLRFGTEKNRRLGSKKARYNRAFRKRHLFCLHIMAESKGFEPSNTRLDVTRFPIVLLRPARTTLHIQRALGASAYSLLIQNLVVRGELIQLFLKLILGLLLRGGDGIMAGEATVAKTESGLLRKFVSRFYTKIPQAVNP